MKYLVFLWIMAVPAMGQSDYQKDFLEFWNDVNDHYAYLGNQHIDWMKVRSIYGPLSEKINTRDDFIRFLETVINELHNGHISLNTNLETSNKIIPSGSDMYIEKINGKYFITDIRKFHPAELAGLRPGMEIIRFNGKTVDEQLQKFLPKYTSEYTGDMTEYAMNMLFAGTHDKKRVITVIDNGNEKDYMPDDFENKLLPGILQYKILGNNTGYIFINNSLYDDELIPAFDSALNHLSHTKRLVIDLTETPGGGNSAVARAIMGRFADRELPYQKHELFETAYKIRRSWEEFVTPRPPVFSGEVIILVGHWTGSMGEGIAIGFDGMGKATVIGTKMAGLLGAIEGFTLPATGIGFQIPTEKLYHVNGTPREDFIPPVHCSNIYETWERIQ